MAIFKKVSGGEHGVISEQGSIESVVHLVNLLDLAHEVWELVVHGGPQFVQSEKSSLSSVWLPNCHIVQHLIHCRKLLWQFKHWFCVWQKSVILDVHENVWFLVDSREHSE